MANKRSVEKMRFEKLFSFFFTHGLLLSRKEFLVFFFSRTAAEISRMDFFKKFSRKDLCFTYTFKKKNHAINWLSRTLSDKKNHGRFFFLNVQKKHWLKVSSV